MKSSIIIFFCLLGLSLQRSIPQDNSYVAAVVEFQMHSDSIADNIPHYLKLIRQAAQQKADIIVFPELTLSHTESIIVPMNGLLKEHPIPALKPELFNKTLVSISSVARQNKIYVVINVEEVVDCTKGTPAGERCPEKKKYLFNTNVVFDRSGAVIDRYRKINLFGEIGRTPALTPDLGIFTTDFGVTFGHFICFDLMFQIPSVQVVQKLNITNIVYPTMWFPEMPFLTAVSIQEAYANSMNVNFLAAGANNIEYGSAGSGIYSGKAGALVSIMPGKHTTRLLVSRVPKVPGQVSRPCPGPIRSDPKELDNLYIMRDETLVLHVTRRLRRRYEEFTLADHDVLCNFRIRMREGTANNTYIYRAAAFSGVRPNAIDDGLTGGNRICSIFACTGNTIDTCGQRFPNFQERATAVFEELSIIATVPRPQINVNLSANNSSYYPVSLDTSIMPLTPEDFEFQSINIDRVAIYRMMLRKPVSNIYSFAIWGREFSTDGQKPSPPGQHN